MSRGFNGNIANWMHVTNPGGILDSTGNLFTLALWIRPNAVFSATALLASKYDGTNGYGLQGISTGKVTAFIAVSGGFDQVDSTTSPAAETWTHIAMVKNGTGAGALAIFVNGVEEASVTSNRSLPDTTINFNIGIRHSAVSPFNGRLAEIVAWNQALTDAEILALGKGASPLLVHPGGTPPYYPLWGVGGGGDPDLSLNRYYADEQGNVSVENHAPVACPFPIAV